VHSTGRRRPPCALDTQTQSQGANSRLAVYSVQFPFQGAQRRLFTRLYPLQPEAQRALPLAVSRQLALQRSNVFVSQRRPCHILTSCVYYRTCTDRGISHPATLPITTHTAAYSVLPRATQPVRMKSSSTCSCTFLPSIKLAC
jgi:hypothetical protein